ncbi:MAG: HAD family hydrolase [Thermomicrobiales bacterium]
MSVAQSTLTATASSIKALIFDMDGLLVDSESLAEAAMHRFLANHGVAIRPEVQAQLLGRRLPEAIALVAEAYAITTPQEELIRSYDGLRFAALRGNVRPMPGAAEIVEFGRAAGFRLALATSGMRRHADLSLSETGLAGSFEVEVTGDDVERGKPAPDLFLLAAARLGVAPRSCIVFEDAPPGVAAAVAAGMRVIAVPNDKSRAMQFPVEADAVLADLHAAIGWLRDQGVVGIGQGD